MQWNLVDLSAYVVAGARRGGPLGTSYQLGLTFQIYATYDERIAVTRDASAIVEYGSQISTKPQIQIYSSSGALIKNIPVCVIRPIVKTTTELETLLHLVGAGSYHQNGMDL